jgi:hypothetical protein
VEDIHFMQKGAKLGYFDDFRNRRILAEREDYREYFVWARSQSEAKARLASLPKSQASTRCNMRSETSDVR